jgi:hypothetical protein
LIYVVTWHQPVGAASGKVGDGIRHGNPR